MRKKLQIEAKKMNRKSANLRIKCGKQNSDQKSGERWEKFEKERRTKRNILGFNHSFEKRREFLLSIFLGLEAEYARKIVVGRR